MKEYIRLNQVLNSESYLGRGIIIGLTSDGTNLVVAYFLTGRSANSRNRILIFKNHSVETRPFSKKIKNKDLLIYEPIVEFRNFIAISNGNHTKTIVNGLKQNLNLFQIMHNRNFENDPPIFTPRICGLINLRKITYEMAIVKSLNSNPLITQRCFYSYSKPECGFGHLIHTYDSDAMNNDEIVSFKNEPLLIEISSNQNTFHNIIWNSLNQKYRISLLTEYIDLKAKKICRRISNINF